MVGLRFVGESRSMVRQRARLRLAAKHFIDQCLFKVILKDTWAPYWNNQIEERWRIESLANRLIVECHGESRGAYLWWVFRESREKYLSGKKGSYIKNTFNIVN